MTKSVEGKIGFRRCLRELVPGPEDRRGGIRRGLQGGVGASGCRHQENKVHIPDSNPFSSGSLIVADIHLDAPEHPDPSNRNLSFIRTWSLDKAAIAVCRTVPLYGAVFVFNQVSGSGFGIRIGSGSRKLKRHTKIERSSEIFCFEVLDVLFKGLKASPEAWTSVMEA